MWRKAKSRWWLQVQLLMCGSEDWNCWTAPFLCCFWPVHVGANRGWKHNIQIRQHNDVYKNWSNFLTQKKKKRKLNKSLHRINGIFGTDTLDQKVCLEPKKLSTVSTAWFSRLKIQILLRSMQRNLKKKFVLKLVVLDDEVGAIWSCCMEWRYMVCRHIEEFWRSKCMIYCV